MSDEPKTYPDTREGLQQMLLDSDAGFGLYKRYHWQAVVRDVVGPWLDAHDENVIIAERLRRERELAAKTPPTEHPTPAHARISSAVDSGATFYRGWLHDLRDVLGYTPAEGPENTTYEPVGTQHRAVYPETLTADSPFTSRALDDEQEAAAFASFVNRRLVASGLPEAAYIESRQVLATSWERSA